MSKDDDSTHACGPTRVAAAASVDPIRVYRAAVPSVWPAMAMVSVVGWIWFWFHRSLSFVCVGWLGAALCGVAFNTKQIANTWPIMIMYTMMMVMIFYCHCRHRFGSTSGLPCFISTYIERCSFSVPVHSAFFAHT